MTLLEYKSMSLPYGLKAQFPETNEKGCSKKVIGTIQAVYDDGSIVCYDTIDAYPTKFKLILRPLSDLTKEIEHKGEKFVPIDQLKEAIGIGNWCEAYDNALEVLVDNIESYRLVDLVERMPYQFVIQFIKWHFDIADLISKGEAIDVNTLKVNPYK